MVSIRSAAKVLIFAGLLLLSCKEETILGERVVRLMITQSNFFVLDVSDTSEVMLGYLTDFSLDDHRNINSVRFTVIGGCNFNADLETFRVWLFDLTKNTVIKDSEVEFGPGVCPANGYSKDIKSNFPNQRIDLGIMISSPDRGTLWGSYLYLYRD